MAKVITAAAAAVVIPAAVTEACDIAVNAEKSNYGARCAFAVSINNLGGEVRWYAVEGLGQKLPPMVAAVKERYYAGLKAINYSNPSNAWRMIKEYGLADAKARGLFGEEPATDSSEGEGEGTEGEGGNTRTNRSVQTRLVEDSKVLFDFLMREKAKGNLEPKHDEYLSHLLRAMKAIGMTVGV